MLFRSMTFRVLHGAQRIAEYVAVWHKAVFKRVRPSRIDPYLRPPFGPPGHAAFPSGHATAGWLIQLCLNEVVNTKRPEATAALSALGRRVGRLREIAGFHYPSDSVAGRQLAQRCFDWLIAKKQNKPVCPEFSRLVAAAKAEW